MFPAKTNGLIVDYVGVFKSLEKALALYASPVDDGDDELPIRKKDELVDALSTAGFERVERHVELSIFSEYRAQRPL